MRSAVWFGVLASALTLHSASPLIGQSVKAKVDMSAPAPRLPNGKPDFSGVWARLSVQDLTRTFTNSVIR